jgi:hypothetical protein
MEGAGVAAGCVRRVSAPDNTIEARGLVKRFVAQAQQVRRLIALPRRGDRS